MTDQTLPGDPQHARSTGKAARATTRLRDVNRCRVRPKDLIVHLGIMPFAPRNVLLVDPALPAWLPERTVRNVRVGSARVALRARRTAEGRSELEVLESGGVRVVTPGVLPPGQDRLAVGFHAMLSAG